jgi:dihydrofolate reductase
MSKQSRVILDISMSLDGFVRASNATPEEPLGVGGERLHEWALGNSDLIAKSLANTAAIITGRRNYDDSLPWWGPDGPTGDMRLPLFVVTHAPPTEVPADSVYRFVTDGLESAVAQAKALAPGKDVFVMGGADLAQQMLRAGLIDEIGIHLVPVLFHDGLRLFEHLGPEHIQLEAVEVLDTPLATHLRYRVVR